MRLQERLRRFEALAGGDAEAGIVVYGGGQTRTRGEHRILPWSQIHTLTPEI